MTGRFTTDDELLTAINKFINRYVAFQTDHHAVVVTLWAVHTWVVNAFYVTPRLILDSAEPGSGKTRVLELLALLCRSAKLTLSTTTAALYRRIAAAADEGHPPPTVLQDEADAIFGKTSTPQAEDLRALFNAGYKRGATVDRCEGDAARMRVKEFPVFAPVALAGLAGRMPATITTRGITLHMRRRRPDQTLDEFRERDAVIEVTEIREHLNAWAEANHDVLAAARPPMPAGVTDRSAEIWEPLLAIADQVGGDWPILARRACIHFVVDSAAEDEKLSLGQRLLRDIKELLAAEQVTAMWSADLISKLVSDPESEWRDLWGKTLDQRRLAKELSRYGVKSKDIRMGVAKNKGYAVDGPTGLQQAWDHWLAPSVSATSATSATLQLDVSRTVADTTTTATSATHPRHSYLPSELHQSRDVADVADVADTDGIVRDTSSRTQTLCPDCHRAPARPDTGRCDFCTARHRRQQTASGRPKMTAREWFGNHIAELQAAGHITARSFAVYSAGEAAGYTRNNLSQAAQAHPDVKLINRKGGGATWSIAPGMNIPNYQSAAQWLDAWLDQRDVDTVTPGEAKLAGEAAGHPWHSVRRAAGLSSRIESIPAHGDSKTERIWRIVATQNEDAS